MSASNVVGHIYEFRAEDESDYISVYVWLHKSWRHNVM